jgi:hypothetical protein
LQAKRQSRVPIRRFVSVKALIFNIPLYLGKKNIFLVNVPEKGGI